MTGTPIYDDLLEKQNLATRVTLLRVGLLYIANLNPKISKVLAFMKAGA